MDEQQLNWSKRVSSVLGRYPQWHQMVIEAINKPFLDIMCCPNVMEVFDQHGLLVGRLHNSVSYECTRNDQDKSEFIAWLFDGELAIFYVDSEVVVNRLQLLTEFREVSS